MTRKDFKLAYGQARQSGTGFEFSANGLRAYCGTDSVMYLDDAGAIKRSPHQSLDTVATCREMGLKTAAFQIIAIIKETRQANNEAV